MCSVMDFARRFCFRGRGTPISFEGRDYLRAIYGAYPQNIVLRCSRQVEKSTFIANSILYELTMQPGRAICYVAPRDSQAKLFSRTRLGALIMRSSLLRRKLLGGSRRSPPVNDVEFENGSMLHIRSAYQHADATRGISIQSLYLDEYQDLAANALPIIQEAMSHSANPRTVIAGTPKLVENPLEQVYARSTRCEWIIPCGACGRGNPPDLSIFGAHRLQCGGCQQPLDVRQGNWIAQNPHALWQGYWVNHLMVPWLDFEDVLLRQSEYDDVQFRNEVLGLSTALGDHVITMPELEACCGASPLIPSSAELRHDLRSHLVAGIDWGAGGAANTAICIGYLDPHSRIFKVVHFSRIRGREQGEIVINQIAELCRRFQVFSIAADAGGAGTVLNRLLYQEYTPQIPFTAIRYAATDHAPTLQDPFHHWIVDRTRSLGHLISRAKSRHIEFPRFEQSRPFLEEFACEIAEYDEHMRTLRYTHPPNTQDDCLHACNYALLQAGRAFEASSHLAYDWVGDE